LIALGFRESDGSVLSLPINTDIYDLTARKLELEVGLDILRKRIAMDKTSDLRAHKLPSRRSKSAVARVEEYKTSTPVEEEGPPDTARYAMMISLALVNVLILI
jgi:hypothetical protein